MNLGDRYLVVGRPPPEGRDLDVLARAADAAALVERLRLDGFVERGGRWVRFRDCDVEVVDVNDVDTWGLPAAEVDALFAASSGGRPSPVHTVLLEARRWTRGGGRTERRRSRVAEALRAGAEVWDEVVRRAPAWGVERSLPVMRGDAASLELARRVHRRAVRPRGRVVTFSGLDGSGKSSQAEALRATLDRLGYPAVTVWTRITINPSLDVIAAPVKRLLGGGRPPTPTPAATADRSPGHGARETDPARAFRLRHPTVNQAWLLVVAVVNALAQWRAVTPHLARGRVVVCDRYTLDSAAHLRYKYGPQQRFRMQARAIRWLSPRPMRSYFLDVDGVVAHARKPEKYTAEQLGRLATLYREEADDLRVQRLDGERSRAELCAEIADDVLTALIGQRRRRFRTR
jgi:thymidylate kinase